MLEMQLIMTSDNLRALSKERWRSHLAAIMDQAEIEAPHNKAISDILKDIKDESTGM